MSIDLEITLQDAKFIAGMLRAAGKQREWTSELDKTAKASKRADESLDRMAASVNRMHATPIQKYNSEIEKLDKLLARAKISQDIHARATAAAKTELDKAAAAAKNFGTAGQASVADVAGSLGVVTTAAGAAAAAVGVVTAALRAAKEQAREAAAEGDKLFNVRRTLNQVATSPEHLKSMMDRADNAAQKYGLKREKAHEIMADAVGSGFEKDYESVVAAHAGAVDAGAAGGMAKKLLSIYKGNDPKLSAKSAIDMTLNAAKTSDLTFEDLASGVPQAAEGGSLVGSSAEETVATLSVLGGQFGSVQTAADRIKGFGARAGTDDRLKGKGLVGAFRTLRDEFSEKERKKFLGDSQELNVMYQKMKENEAAIVQRTNEVKAARKESEGGNGEVQQALNRADKTPQLRAAIIKQRAENARDIAKEAKLGEHGQLQATGMANAEETALTENRNALNRFGNYVTAGASTYLGASGGTVETAGKLGGAVTELGAGSLLGPFVFAGKLLQQAATELSNATRKKPPVHHAAQVEHAQTIN